MNPWLDPSIAQQQRQLVDAQLAAKPWPPHFLALAESVRATNCPGDLLIAGCGVGHEREVFDRAGVEYRSVTGVDISPEALRLAKERYPESRWIEIGADEVLVSMTPADVVIDAACMMHVPEWRDHLAALCRASRRHVILHRVPLADFTVRTETQGYGQTFPAWTFGIDDLMAEMTKNGYSPMVAYDADAAMVKTLAFAKARRWATYSDRNYLPRLKALHASMVRHCGPFKLHVLAWDDKVDEWCVSQKVDVTHVDDFLDQRPDLGIRQLPWPPRTRVEQMWTIGPAFVASVMERTGEPVTYVDADLYAFSSPEPFFAEAGGAPAAFVGHNFAPASRGTPGPTVETHAEPFGALNVGLCHFNDIKAAERWAELVRGWCYDRVEKVFDGPLSPTIFADQKYLEWIVRDGKAIVIKNEAAMVGPWNANARALWVKDGVPHFGGRPIGFYHFSALQLGPHGQWSPTRPEYQLSERVIDILYTDYLRELTKEIR